MNLAKSTKKRTKSRSPISLSTWVLNEENWVLLGERSRTSSTTSNASPGSPFRQQRRSKVDLGHLTLEVNDYRAAIRRNRRINLGGLVQQPAGANIRLGVVGIDGDGLADEIGDGGEAALQGHKCRFGVRSLSPLNLLLVSLLVVRLHGSTCQLAHLNAVCRQWPETGNHRDGSTHRSASVERTAVDNGRVMDATGIAAARAAGPYRFLYCVLSKIEVPKDFGLPVPLVWDVSPDQAFRAVIQLVAVLAIRNFVESLVLVKLAKFLVSGALYHLCNRLIVEVTENGFTIPAESETARDHRRMVTV